MMNNKDFAAFILTHGRADIMKTDKALRKFGYTGRIIYVIDNEDKTADEYYKKFGRDNVVMFDKLKISKEIDECDNFNKRTAIVYARNASFEIAKNLGLKYFIMLDDDYVRFSYKHTSKNIYKNRGCYQLDGIFDAMIGLLNSNKSIKAVAMSQEGDHIGGINSGFADIELHRKCMNSFLCAVDRPFKFIGRLNEDVTTYTTLGSRGDLFFTIASICLSQLSTQSLSGGISDTYKEEGTYVKSFYSVMSHPSSIKIATMGPKNRRIHHKIDWELTVPKIINEKFKKYDKR